MNPRSQAEWRAINLISERGGDREQAQWMLATLREAGLRIADDSRDELICRWVSVAERPVPPEADTIIRTITRTLDGVSRSTTHWLDGLRSPRIP